MGVEKSVRTLASLTSAPLCECNAYAGQKKGASHEHRVEHPSGGRT